MKHACQGCYRNTHVHSHFAFGSGLSVCLQRLRWYLSSPLSQSESLGCLSSNNEPLHVQYYEQQCLLRPSTRKLTPIAVTL